MKKIMMLPGRHLVKQDVEDLKTAGGLFIPDSSAEKQLRGTVIVASFEAGFFPNGETIPTYVKKDSRVLFGKYAGTLVEIDGEEFLVLKEEEILGVEIE